LYAKLAIADRVRERIFNQVEAVIEKGIVDFDKSDEEESKEDESANKIINSLNR